MKLNCSSLKIVGNSQSSRNRAANSPEKQNKEVLDQHARRSKTSESVVPLPSVERDPKRLGTLYF